MLGLHLDKFGSWQLVLPRPSREPNRIHLSTLMQRHDHASKQNLLPAPAALQQPHVVQNLVQEYLNVSPPFCVLGSIASWVMQMFLTI